jgi:hypothetical protein
MNKKIDTTGYDFNDIKAAHLMPLYEPLFAPLVGRGIKFLELGVQQGVSLRFWRDYFENAMIVGLDSNPPIKIDDPNKRIHIYQGYQQDTQLLDRIAKEQAPDGFDIVIDDCSHIGRLSRISFWHLFQNHLKPGGLYAIEDWATGYLPWPNWPDGNRYKPRSPLVYPCKERLIDSFSHWFQHAFTHFPRLAAIPQRLFITQVIPSHQHGMVGFIKEIIDASTLGEKAIPRSGSGRYRYYGVSQLHIVRWLVIVEKAAKTLGNTT